MLACGSNDECQARNGTGCCTGCGNDWIGIRKDAAASLQKLFCDGEQDDGCPECGPSLPAGSVVCKAGVCAVGEPTPID
jgi:hypothetical protein